MLLLNPSPGAELGLGRTLYDQHRFLLFGISLVAAVHSCMTLYKIWCAVTRPCFAILLKLLLFHNYCTQTILTWISINITY